MVPQPVDIPMRTRHHPREYPARIISIPKASANVWAINTSILSGTGDVTRPWKSDFESRLKAHRVPQTATTCFCRRWRPFSRDVPVDKPAQKGGNCTADILMRLDCWEVVVDEHNLEKKKCDKCWIYWKLSSASATCEQHHFSIFARQMAPKNLICGSSRLRHALAFCAPVWSGKFCMSKLCLFRENSWL